MSCQFDPQRLHIGLVQRGHSDETIRKILGENVLRVARSNFAG